MAVGTGFCDGLLLFGGHRGNGLVYSLPEHLLFGIDRLGRVRLHNGRRKTAGLRWDIAPSLGTDVRAQQVGRRAVENASQGHAGQVQELEHQELGLRRRRGAAARSSGLEATLWVSDASAAAAGAAPRGATNWRDAARRTSCRRSGVRPRAFQRRRRGVHMGSLRWPSHWRLPLVLPLRWPIASARRCRTSVLQQRRARMVGATYAFAIGMQGVASPWSASLPWRHAVAEASGKAPAANAMWFRVVWQKRRFGTVAWYWRVCGVLRIGRAIARALRPEALRDGHRGCAAVTGPGVANRRLAHCALHALAYPHNRAPG
mmetsp:Transcript_38102/g.104888  ORF Transcript_38102/g.104888 Transcript_38102/m.104888 type:complete len:317 (+) Transcript_38102:2195-3145(+)